MVIGLAVAFGAIKWRSELPWFDVQGVKCHKGEVYVGLGFFSTILVYDAAGRHVRSIAVDTHAKPYFFRVDPDGAVHTTWTYASRSDPEQFSLRTDPPERTLRFRCAGEEEGVLHQNMWLLLFAGPLPGGLIGFMSILGIFIFNPNALTKLFERAARSRA